MVGAPCCCAYHERGSASAGTCARGRTPKAFPQATTGPAAADDDLRNAMDPSGRPTPGTERTR